MYKSNLGGFSLYCFRPQEGSATPAEKQNDEKTLGVEDEKQMGDAGMLTCCLMDNILINNISSRC